jgi:hypothetical protein
VAGDASQGKTGKRKGTELVARPRLELIEAISDPAIEILNSQSLIQFPGQGCTG